MIYADKDSSNILGFFDKHDKTVPGDWEFLKALQEANEKMKGKLIKDIDWNKLKNLLESELFKINTYNLKLFINPEYDNPEKLIEWFKQTLENI